MAYEVQRGYGVGFKVTGIDSEQLDKAIKKPWASDGKNFSDRIWSKKTQMVDTLHGEIIRSMLTGGNTKEAISIMQKYVRNDVKNAKYAAARLIRTESAYFASEGQKKCFNDLDVEKYEIVATLDNRTSDICQGMDGQVFEMKDFETGVTAPPFHVNCRSTTAPYFDDEFAKGERAARGADGKTYYVPSDMTYKEWKGKQDEIAKSDNKYNNIVIPYGYDVDKHSKEIKNANIINNELGGNIQMLNERVDQKTADMLWNDKLWEIKNVSSHSSIDHAIRNGLKQIIDNQGGIILNIDNSKLELDEIKNVIQKRFNRAGEEYKNLNVILVKNDKILENMTIEKEAFPSAKRGTSSASYVKDISTEPLKSQLKSDEKDDILENSGSRHRIIKLVKDKKLEKLDYEKFTKQLTEEQIIDRLSGGDMTKGGSCASVAYAYVANKAGFDILDFRGGKSEEFFKEGQLVTEIMKLDGVVSYKEKHLDAIEATKKVLTNAQIGKEYLLAVGNHMAVVKKDKEGLKYLELQDKTKENNGYHKLDKQILKKRFGAKKSWTVYGNKLEQTAKLIDCESLGNNNVFQELVKYVNTKENKQLKGENGRIK